MSQATITIPDELRRELEAYARRQEEPPELSTVVQRVLREFLEQQKSDQEREYRAFRVTPADIGSGESDVSINHDKYFADDAYEDAFSRFREES